MNFSLFSCFFGCPKNLVISRLTHNWWHVALCYLEGSSPIQRVLEIYDHCILKELERSDAACPEVYCFVQLQHSPFLFIIYYIYI